MNRFQNVDPLSRFLQGQDIAKERQMRDFNFEQRKQQAAFNQGQQQFGQEMQQIKVINQAARALQNIPQEQYGAALQKLSPVLQSAGVDVAQSGLDNPESVPAVLDTTTRFLQDPNAVQQLTSFQQNINTQADALVGATNPETGEPFTRETAMQAIVARQSGIVPRAGSVTGTERIATTPGLTEAVAGSGREIKAEAKRGELEAKAAVDVVKESFDRIGKINANIRNIDRAISALDRGAGTGKVERLLPSVKAASIELDNIRNELGLDIVGATTFGALSKGELDLALDTGLPPLDDPDLRGWLQRKRDAQTKLVDYLDEQIDFLEEGGTLGEWRSFIRGKGQQAAEQDFDLEYDPATGTFK